MKVVVQQALFHHFRQPVGRIANLAVINPRTAWNHIHAAQKSHIKTWDTRSPAEQDAAIKEAELIVKGNQMMSNSIVPTKRNRPVRTRRAKIPAAILQAMIDAEISKRVQADDTFTAYSITLLLRVMNPGHEIVHSEVQARVRFVMLGYSNYELVFQSWNGENARTWRPTQAPTAIPVQFSVQPQPVLLTSGIRIVDDE